MSQSPVIAHHNGELVTPEETQDVRNMDSQGSHQSNDFIKPSLLHIPLDGKAVNSFI